MLPESGTPTEDQLEASMEGLSALAAGYYDRLGETARELTDRASNVYGATRGYVRRTPGGPMLGAFVVGVVVGVLMDRD